jgi:hypothetical protein
VKKKASNELVKESTEKSGYSLCNLWQPLQHVTQASSKCKDEDEHQNYFTNIQGCALLLASLRQLPSWIQIFPILPQTEIEHTSINR